MLERDGAERTDGINIGQVERVLSVSVGAALVVVGLALRSRRGLGLAFTGAGLAYRGLSGQCPIYQALGFNCAEGQDTTSGNLGMKVERSAPIDAPPDRLYAFWRDFRNLPIVMPNVERVDVLSDTRSHWVVKGPLGTTLEWDAEIINDVPNQRIGWRTASGARVEHAGSVRFEPRADGGTLVWVTLQYNPPGGEFTHMVSQLFGEDPGKRLEEDLERLREAFGRAHEDRDGLQPTTADALGYSSERMRRTY
jgi:uncharacterized membrane protein